MKRGLVAMALAILLCAGEAGADYLRIKVDIKNATPNIAGTNVQGSQGGPGGVPRPPAKGFGGGPLPGNQPGSPGAGPDNEKDRLWITVYLEIKGKPQVKGIVGAGVKVIELDHQFGKHTFVPIPPRPQGAPPPFLEVEFIEKGSLAGEHDRRLKKLKDSKKAKDFIDLAFWDWSHGLTKEFHATIDELKKLDAKHAVVAAHHKVQTQLKAAPAGDDPSLKGLRDELRAENYRPMVSDQGHYVLFSNLTPDKDHDAKIKRRLKRLEETLESFYYWFALQDSVPVPPMPRHRLLGVLISEPGEFYKKHKSWGSEPMLGNGFTPRRDNIMVLSLKRLDEPYVLMENWTAQQMRPVPNVRGALEMNELLSGTVWNRSDAKPNALPLAVIQTIAVVQKAMEEEAERTTISHEAVRQLLAATGLLPHNVAAPEWIQEGLAGYFERPFGAVYGAGGLPSWSNLVAFKHYKAGLGKGRDILRGVLTDRYFQLARIASIDLEEGKGKPEKVHEDWDRARATAWALVYYLDKQQKMDRLFTYANDISLMPRDLELDQGALEASFAKAFGLADAKNAMKLDQGRLQSFADNWLEYMKTVFLELPGEEVESMKTRQANASKGAKNNEPPAKGPAETIPPPPSN